MHKALIIMTILGCDDTASQCHYVTRVEESWPSIAACEAASERRLNDYSSISYPVVVAVCQTPDTPEATIAEAEPPETAASAAEPGADAAPPPVGKDAGSTDSVPAADGLSGRIVAEIGRVLPQAETVKALVSRPIHVISDGYSWVARRF